jgi:hypothetical protein
MSDDAQSYATRFWNRRPPPEGITVWLQMAVGAAAWLIPAVLTREAVGSYLSASPAVAVGVCLAAGALFGAISALLGWLLNRRCGIDWSCDLILGAMVVGAVTGAALASAFAGASMIALGVGIGLVLGLLGSALLNAAEWMVRTPLGIWIVTGCLVAGELLGLVLADALQGSGAGLRAMSILALSLLLGAGLAGTIAAVRAAGRSQPLQPWLVMRGMAKGGVYAVFLAFCGLTSIKSVGEGFGAWEGAAILVGGALGTIFGTGLDALVWTLRETPGNES